MRTYVLSIGYPCGEGSRRAWNQTPPWCDPRQPRTASEAKNGTRAAEAYPRAARAHQTPHRLLVVLSAPIWSDLVPFGPRIWPPFILVSTPGMGRPRDLHEDLPQNLPNLRPHATSITFTTWRAHPELARRRLGTAERRVRRFDASRKVV